MLVWDTRAVKREIASGAFDCPTCRSDQPYRHVRAQRCGYVYWIPVVSLADAVEYVECEGCRGTFDGRVLEDEHDQRARIAAYQQGMLHVMAAILLAEGVDDVGKLRRITGIFEGLTGRALTESELEETIVHVEEREADLRCYLQDLEPHLNDVGKERVVQAALFVAACDGRLDEREAKKVKNVARALGMSAARLKRIVAKLPN